MTTAETTAVAALIVASISLIVSSFVALRDRARLRVRSRLIEASEFGPAKILVTLVNMGRRAMIIRSVGGSNSKGRTISEYLEYEKGGLRLGERETYEHRFDRDDTVAFPADGDEILLEWLWIEDSLGIRHKVPKSKHYIDCLWGKQSAH